MENRSKNDYVPLRARATRRGRQGDLDPWSSCGGVSLRLPNDVIPVGRATVRLGILRLDAWRVWARVLDMTTAAELAGKPVHVVFRKPMHHGGIDVISMMGTCGGVTPQFVALNDVQKAYGPGDVDVTEKLGIKGKATLFHTRMVQFIFTT